MTAPRVVQRGNETIYTIRSTDGTLRAFHIRYPKPDGTKGYLFRTPEGEVSHGDVKTPDLPLYASELVGEANTLFVTEGEKDCEALLALDIPAVGTVTGAASCPKPDAIADVARGRNFILWPDNDDGGRTHMQNLAVALTKAGAASLLVINYRPPHNKSVHFPPKGGADDFVNAFDDPADAVEMVRQLVEDWTIIPPVPKPLIRVRPVAKVTRYGTRHDGYDSVSDALIAVYGINARPGKNTKCPKHHDRNASLSVLEDDRRAICHSATCEWSGRGVIARDIVVGVSR